MNRTEKEKKKKKMERIKMRNFQVVVAFHQYIHLHSYVLGEFWAILRTFLFIQISPDSDWISRDMNAQLLIMYVLMMCVLPVKYYDHVSKMKFYEHEKSIEESQKHIQSSNMTYQLVHSSKYNIR